MAKHYLYKHTRWDNGEVFYIGIWTKERKRYTRAKTKRSRNDIRHKIVEKALWFNIYILYESDNYDIIKAMEILLVESYWKKCEDTWCLANITNGWDWALWRIVSQDTRDKISKAQKGKQPAHWNQTRF